MHGVTALGAVCVLLPVCAHVQQLEADVNNVLLELKREQDPSWGGTWTHHQAAWPGPAPR